MIVDDKLVGPNIMDPEKIFCDADLSEIFIRLKPKEIVGCIQHCPFCGAVCQQPRNHHNEHKLVNHYFPAFLGTKLMRITENEVEQRLIDNMTCT